MSVPSRLFRLFLALGGDSVLLKFADVPSADAAFHYLYVVPHAARNYGNLVGPHHELAQLSGDLKSPSLWNNKSFSLQTHECRLRVHILGYIEEPHRQSFFALRAAIAPKEALIYPVGALGKRKTVPGLTVRIQVNRLGGVTNLIVMVVRFLRSLVDERIGSIFPCVNAIETWPHK